MPTHDAPTTRGGIAAVTRLARPWPALWPTLAPTPIPHQGVAASPIRSRSRGFLGS